MEWINHCQKKSKFANSKMRIFCLYKVEQHAVTSNLKGSIHFLNNFSTFSLCGTEPVPALTEREADYKISFGFS